MLTEFQKVKLPNLFNMFDMDADGTINQRDIVRIVDACSVKRGWQNGEKEYKALYNHFISIWENLLEVADKNQDDHLTLEEFLKFYGHIIDNEELYTQMIQGLGTAVFSTFDTNSDGNLSLAEYQDFYRVIGLKTNFATTIYTHLDLDQNGFISITELLKLMDQFFKSQDHQSPGNFIFGPIA